MRSTSIIRALGFLIALSMTLCFSFADDKPAQTKQPLDPEHAKKFAEGLKLFKTKVRPLLMERCGTCHGVDIVEGKFDLTDRKSLLKGGAHGPAVDLKRPAESYLMKLVTHKEQPYMPYEEDKLPQAEIDLLQKWIELGAPYDQPLTEEKAVEVPWQEKQIAADARDFWSFRKLKKTEPPRFVDDRWAETEIDRFLLAKLSEHGITPNERADKRTLIRRAYFDLIGMPPTPAEVQSFLNDDDPQAYSRLIDRLLASEHFGERWARHWLDVARFAESHGFEQDYDRPYAYHFRDFVIQAFNQDMPYDRFVRWQLAGDEIAPGNPQALMATGFLGAGVFPTQITANEVERTRYDALDDMAATTGNAMLGLSIGCARCHDHKYDPIPQGDYYRFVSTFTTAVRSNVDVDMNPDETASKLAAWEEAHKPKVVARKTYETEELSPRYETWLSDDEFDWKSLLQDSPWTLLEVADAKSKNGATLTPQADGAVLATGTNPANDVYTLTTGTIGPLSDIKTLRLEALPHESFKKKGPGRADNGNFALSHIKLFVEDADGKNRREIPLTNPRADFQQNEKNLSIAASLDKNPKSGWAVDPQFGEAHWALFDLGGDAPFSLQENQRLVIELNFAVNTKHAIGRPRLSLSTRSDAAPDAATQSLALSQALRERVALENGIDSLSQTSREALWNYYRSRDEQWVALNDAVQKSLADKPKPNLQKMMIVSEGVKPIRHHTQGADFFEQTFYLRRGDCDQKEGVAKQGFLQVLMKNDTSSDHWKEKPSSDESELSYRRTSLANWITDTENGPGHLLARVIVNRLWQHHFGQGIVSTPNDFGSQGAKPTHPELLDWLAQYLIENDWRLKPVHKLIMTSAAYTQSSEYDEAKAKADMDNQYLWRYEPHRVEAEVIRDSMLAVSGTLDETMFGPGTLDMGHKRRSIYFMIKRSKLIPFLQVFDAPEPLVSVGGRPATTVAPQALMFMNSPYVREYATNFAKLLLKDNSSTEQIVKAGYWKALSRDPNPQELAATAEFIDTQTESYKNEKQSNPRELAVTDFCQTLFSLNEFIYIE
jgi:mono/diheme cytochrome c family protein